MASFLFLFVSGLPQSCQLGTIGRNKSIETYLNECQGTENGVGK